MRILLVDDDEENLNLLEATLLNQNYEIIRCSSGQKALETVEKGPVDLVLMDVIMPGMSGFETTKKIKAVRPVPVILLTALQEQAHIIQGFECGADEFVPRPFFREELLLRIRNLLKLKEYQNTLENVIHDRLTSLHDALKDSVELNREMVFRLLVAAEYKDDDTGKHIVRVGKYSRVIAEQFGFKGEFLPLIENAASMHDLGKIGIPDSILLKPGKLTRDEFEIMKTHAVIGSRILDGSGFPLINMSYDVALTHHEKWDGSGYPSGIKGADIPVTGRIVALSDVFDALTSRRPYKPPFPFAQSLEIIKESRGSHFDPAVVDAFLSGLDRVVAVYNEYRDPGAELFEIDIDDLQKRR